MKNNEKKQIMFKKKLIFGHPYIQFAVDMAT